MIHNDPSVFHHEAGSVLLVVVVIVALLAATVMGHLQVNAEEIQLVQNHVHGAEALAVAEAGLNDALAGLREDPGWNAGFADKRFANGSYTVIVAGPTVTSVGTTSDGFTARIEVQTTRSLDGPPYVVSVNRLRINR